MSKKQATYYGEPLNYNNLLGYIRRENPTVPASEIKIVDIYEKPTAGFLQSEYGDDNDCTIVSIATIVYAVIKRKYGYSKNITFQEIYDVALKYAKKCWYTPSIGTLPFFNRTILKHTLKHFGIDKKVKTAYFKKIGFNAKYFKNYLPMNLSIYKDGRGYYENHSVTIIGYAIYKVQEQEKVFITVLDNWSKERRYIDFDRLHTICSINYIVD